MTAIEPVELVIECTGHFCNQWPTIKIIFNNTLLFDGEIIDTSTLTFNISCSENNSLQIIHYGKRFGENNVWDTNNNNDRYVVINEVLFNGVSIGHETIKKTSFNNTWTEHQLKTNSAEFIKEFTCLPYSSGRLSFNGSITINFTVPVYNWIIDQRFKVSQTNSAYFSDYSSRWHYDQDIKILHEIKKLMKLN